MQRIQIYITVSEHGHYSISRFGNGNGNGNNNNSRQSIWRVNDCDIALVNWLVANVGVSYSIQYAIPMTGDGWRISDGFGDDENLSDWRFSSQLSNYTPKGKFGCWLEIENDHLAVELKLSGLLDKRPRGSSYDRLSLDYEYKPGTD